MDPKHDRSGDADTWFAPPQRATLEATLDLSRFVEQTPLFQAIIDSVDGYLMILNPQRQVLAVNRNLLELLGIPSGECLVGGRPGEIIGCIHAGEGPGGCGTSRACATCGSVVSILASQSENRPVAGECQATVRQGDSCGALSLRVRATPVRVGAHDFTVLVLTDISGALRRELLERTFFHDVLNTLGGLMGWSALLSQIENLGSRQAAERIMILSQRLKQEIEDQRRLSQAERGALEVNLAETDVAQVLATVDSVFELHDAARGRTLAVEPAPEGERIVTDASLLARVLTNMLKNALEAVGEGATVRLWFERREGRPGFFVHNPGVIPAEVAPRIFQRSFSTKSQHGRGIGTYSMKLFGERHLRGQVGFESAEGRGTTFFIRLPE